jgi:hypothetical protein
MVIARWCGIRSCRRSGARGRRCCGVERLRASRHPVFAQRSIPDQAQDRKPTDPTYFWVGVNAQLITLLVRPEGYKGLALPICDSSDERFVDVGRGSPDGSTIGTSLHVLSAESHEMSAMGTRRGAWS